MISSHKKIAIVAALIICTIILSGSIIRPAFIGFATYEKIKNSNVSVDEYGKNVRELENSIIIKSTNLSACTEQNSKLFTEWKNYVEKFSNCQISLGAMSANLSMLSSQSTKKSEDYNNLAKEKNEEIEKLKNKNQFETQAIIDEKNTTISKLNEEYDALARNSANNICCKAKVDNPKIGFYSVNNNKIECLDEGTLSITC